MTNFLGGDRLARREQIACHDTGAGAAPPR
jgi:hypothetical protein